MKNLSWFGTATSVLGSFVLAFKFFLFGYVLFIAGACSWLAVGIVRRDGPLVALNGAFLLANLIGVYNA